MEQPFQIDKTVMADKRTSKLPTKNEGPVFPLFNCLPWELRQMIWERALPHPISQVLFYKRSTFSKWDPKTNTWDATDGPPSVPIPPPALLHATKESRKFCLEHVLVREEEHYGPNPLKRHRVVSRPFDPETDALYIHSEHFADFMWIYLAITPWAARHLVFDNNIYTIRRPLHWFGGCVWDDFESAADRMGPGLRSIALTYRKMCDDSLWIESKHDGVVKGYYRVVPDEEIMSTEDGMCEKLAADFRGRQGPDGAPWKVRIGSGRLCGASGGEDDEELLECSYVGIQRFTASTMNQD